MKQKKNSRAQAKGGQKRGNFHPLAELPFLTANIHIKEQPPFFELLLMVCGYRLLLFRTQMQNLILLQAGKFLSKRSNLVNRLLRAFRESGSIVAGLSAGCSFLGLE